MSRLATLQAVLPDRSAMRHAFARASREFDSASVVHDEARDRLLQRLDFMRAEAGTMLDLGCATGRGFAALQGRFPDAQLIAIDRHEPMLRTAGQRERVSASSLIQADAGRLPLRARSADLILANLLLPWCDPGEVFAEAARALRPGGVLLFSSLGPDTLGELRAAWSGVDEYVHVHAFTDMHDLGDLAVRAGLAEPVINVDRLTVTYEDIRPLVTDLRACGAANVAGGRRRTLTGRNRWRRFESRVLAGRRDGRFPVTVELILGHAWGNEGAADRREGGAEAMIPADRIPLRRRRDPPS